MATKKYELLADSLPLVTSKPGDPLEFTDYVKGDKVPLDDARAKELIAAGAVKDDDSGDDGAEPGAQTEAPGGKSEAAEGVGTGDADAGTIGDGGPDPQGTGSTVAIGGTEGEGDGLGNTESTPSSTPAKKTTSRNR